MAATFRFLKQGIGFWLLLGLGLSLLAGLMLWGFLLTHELVEQQVFTGYTHKAARQNPLLAVERLTRHLGRTAESVRTLEELLSQLEDGPDWVLLSTPSTSLSVLQRDRLLDWVSRGGTLVFAPQRFDAAPAATDLLLTELQIHTQALEPDQCRRQLQTSCLNLETVRIGHGSKPFKVDFDPLRVLHDAGPAPPAATAAQGTGNDAGSTAAVTPTSSSTWPVQGGSGTHGLQRPWGQGQVIVFSDLDWLKNQQLGRQNHAAYWWHLAQQAPRLWLQYQPDLPPWWWHLAQQAPLPLLAIAVSLCLWLLHQAQRFGPPLTRPDLARRSLLEHIQASGQWLWRHQAAQTLLDSQRHTLRQRLQRKHPGWLNQDSSAQLDYLATLTHWPQPRLERALHAPALPQRLGFIQQVEDIRQLIHLL